MKKYIILFLILFLSCKQNIKKIKISKKNEKSEIITKEDLDFNDEEGKLIKKNINSKKSETLELIIKKDNNISKIQTIKSNLDTLFPIEIVNIKSKNIYKKYGLDVAGNCYTCDLAEISIENNEIIISNVCDDGTLEKLNFKIKKFSNRLNKIEIQTEDYKFIFLRVEDEPIFKLKIINYDIKNKDLRISKYFTFKQELFKFELHDCADFDG